MYIQMCKPAFSKGHHDGNAIFTLMSDLVSKFYLPSGNYTLSINFHNKGYEEPFPEGGVVQSPHTREFMHREFVISSVLRRFLNEMRKHIFTYPGTYLDPHDINIQLIVTCEELDAQYIIFSVDYCGCAKLSVNLGAPARELDVISNELQSWDKRLRESYGFMSWGEQEVLRRKHSKGITGNIFCGWGTNCPLRGIPSVPDVDHSSSYSSLANPIWFDYVSPIREAMQEKVNGFCGLLIE